MNYMGQTISPETARRDALCLNKDKKTTYNWIRKSRCFASPNIYIAEQGRQTKSSFN